VAAPDPLPRRDRPAPAWAVGALAVVLGAVLWIGASVLGGRREAWDSAAYWALAYPLALLAAALLGWRFPDRPARWAWLLFAGQFVGMVLRNGELGGLWPLGLVLFGVLALPAVLLARLAARRATA
jgi:hypothetical protein